MKKTLYILLFIPLFLFADDKYWTSINNPESDQNIQLKMDLNESQFLERIHHYPLWKLTSYNSKNNTHSSGDNSKALRGNYASIGMTYDEDNDIFLPKKPHASWDLNTSEARWQSPIGDDPGDADESAGEYYVWNESEQSWDKNTK